MICIMNRVRCIPSTSLLGSNSKHAYFAANSKHAYFLHYSRVVESLEVYIKNSRRQDKECDTTQVSSIKFFVSQTM